MVAAADAASTSNFVPPPANNTIEEELAQLQRRLEEKEAEVANLTARMVGVNNQAQQVKWRAKLNKWLVRPNNQRGHLFRRFWVVYPKCHHHL